MHRDRNPSRPHTSARLRRRTIRREQPSSLVLQLQLVTRKQTTTEAVPPMVNLLKTKRGSNDDVYTPPELFAELRCTFDLDVCAPKGGIPWIPAARHYSVQDDGLAQPWEGRVWMNPPYSKPQPWIDRFIQHENGIALLPTSTGKWMIELWQEPKTKWTMLHKFRFVKPSGERYETCMPTRVWLVAIGQENVEAIANIGQTR